MNKYATFFLVLDYYFFVLDRYVGWMRNAQYLLNIEAFLLAWFGRYDIYRFRLSKKYMALLSRPFQRTIGRFVEIGNLSEFIHGNYSELAIIVNLDVSYNIFGVEEDAKIFA